MTTLLKIEFLFFFLLQLNEYNFNRKLVYEVTYFKDQKKSTVITYLTNEQDNYYNAYLWPISGKQDDLTFVDQDGIYFHRQIDTGMLSTPGFNLKKEDLSIYRNPYNYQVRNYDFSELKDTLLDNKIYKRFILKSKNVHTGKRKKPGSEIYIIDTAFNMRPLLTSPTAYEIWKSRKNLPNGLIVEKYYFDSENEMVRKEKLKSNEVINIKFHMPEM